MTETLKTQPLDAVVIIQAQLNEISQDVRIVAADARLIPQVQAQMTILMEGYDRLEKYMQTNVAALQRRDSEQQALLDSLPLRIHENVASITILSSAIHDLQRQHENYPLIEFSTLDNERGAQIEQLSTRQIELSTRQIELTQRLDAHDFVEWLPWLRGLRWLARIFVGFFVAAVAGSILWALVNSGAGLP